MLREGLIIVAAAVALVAHDGVAKEASKEVSQEDLTLNDAKWQCAEQVRQGLDYPDRAKFDYFAYFPIQQQENGTYNVEAGFQENETAPKKKVRCVMRRLPSGEWKMEQQVPLP